MICTPNTGHLVWGYFYALDLLSQVKKLAQHSNSIFAICNSQLLPTNQICGLLSYPKKTKNPNPSPIGNRFGFFLFGGRGWITQAALLKTAHWAVFALSSATAPQLFESTRHHESDVYAKENRQCISTLAVFSWARVDYASRASKKAPQGPFCRRDV